MMNINKSKSRKSKSNQGIVKNPSARQPPYPPKFQANIALKHRFRYVSLTSGFSLITSNDLISALYVQSGSNVAARYSLLSAFRLRKVYLWAQSGTVSVEFTTTVSSNSGTNSKVYSDTSYGGTYYSKVCAVPPAGSNSSLWQNVVSISVVTQGVQFYVQAPEGAILDIVMDVVLQNEDPYYFIGSFAGPLTQGTIYQSYLDATTFTTWQPVSYNYHV